MATKTKAKSTRHKNSDEFEKALAARHPMPDLYRPGHFTMMFRTGFPVTELDHEANAHNVIETARNLGISPDEDTDNVEIVSDEVEAPERSDDPDYVRLHSVRKVVYTVPVNEVRPVETRSADEDAEPPAVDPSKE